MNWGIYSIFTTIYFFIEHKFLEKFIGNVKRFDFKFCCSYLLVIIITVLLNYKSVEIIYKMVFSIISFLAISSLYGSSWVRRIVGVILILGIAMIQEITFSLIVQEFELKYSLNSVFFLSILFFYFVYKITVFLFNFNSNPIPIKHTLIFSITPIMSTLLIWRYFKNPVGLIFLFFVFYSNIFLFEVLSNYFSKSLYSQALESQNNSLKGQIDLIAYNKEQTEKIRHDIKRELELLARMIDKGDIEEAKSSLEQYRSKTPVRKLQSSTGNFYIDHLLEVKLLEAEKLEVEATMELAPISLEKGGLNDLYLLLSNLLDNSLEALKFAKDKVLFVNLETKGGFLDIIVKNSYSDLNKEREGREHGYGLIIIQDIVTKYSGRYKVSKKEDYYQTEISMKIK